MNRNQKIAVAVAAANLLVLLLFPPFDQYSISSSKLPVFSGFNFVFAPLPRSEVNFGVLIIEVIVLAVNAAVAWLLLRDRPSAPGRRRMSMQNAVLVFTAANLVLVLLFPPFESVFAVTNAALPNFEGFYFIFSHKTHHTIVTTVLQIEVIFILINGALFWLVFRTRRSAQLTPEQIRALSAHWKEKR